MPQLEFWHFLPQFFWLTVSFVFLYVIMAFVALPRIGRVLNERKLSIENDLNAAERARTEAEQARQEYEDSLHNARDSARVLVVEALQASTDASQQRLEELERETDRRISETRGSIDAARSEALANLQGVAAEAARLATSRLIGADVSDDEVARALASVQET